jgi:electron transport complex protein RnfD
VSAGAPAAPVRTFVLTPGPHLRASVTTAKILWTVNASLLPVTLWGIWMFGWNALFVIVAAITGAVGSEWLALKAMKRRFTFRDGTAFCAGLLLALTLPPMVPWWMALLGGAFGILFGKMIFGGLGNNLFNPACVARAFMLATFPLPMTTAWAVPRHWFAGQLDAISTATPLRMLKEEGMMAADKLLASQHGLWPTMLLGFRPGAIGEVSVLLLALGAAILLQRRIIGFAIPLSVFAGVALSTAFTGALDLHLTGGGLWLGAFYMATDYVTSPNTRPGQIVFGLLVGLLTGVIRVFGGYPEGICYAILISNAMVPALNLWFRPRRAAAVGSPS